MCHIHGKRMNPGLQRSLPRPSSEVGCSMFIRAQHSSGVKLPAKKQLCDECARIAQVSNLAAAQDPAAV